MKLTVPSIGSSTHRTPATDSSPPPSSSPRTASPGRSCASNSRRTRSVSVSTTVTGSVGVLLDCTAPASASGLSPNTCGRRVRTCSAASVATRTATPRSTSASRVVDSVSDRPRVAGVCGNCSVAVWVCVPSCFDTGTSQHTSAVRHHRSTRLAVRCSVGVPSTDRRHYCSEATAHTNSIRPGAAST